MNTPARQKLRVALLIYSIVLVGLPVGFLLVVVQKQELGEAIAGFRHSVSIGMSTIMFVGVFLFRGILKDISLEKGKMRLVVVMAVVNTIGFACAMLLSLLLLLPDSMLGFCSPVIPIMSTLVGVASAAVFFLALVFFEPSLK